jgi:hypothetical protein
MMPLLALARSHEALTCTAAVIAAPVVVSAIHASPSLTWEALRPLFEHAKMTASLVIDACILYDIAARWIPQR